MTMQVFTPATLLMLLLLPGQPRKLQRFHHFIIQRRIWEVSSQRGQLQALASGQLLRRIQRPEGKGRADIREKSSGKVGAAISACDTHPSAFVLSSSSDLKCAGSRIVRIVLVFPQSLVCFVFEQVVLQMDERSFQCWFVFWQRPCSQSTCNGTNALILCLCTMI